MQLMMAMLAPGTLNICSSSQCNCLLTFIATLAIIASIFLIVVFLVYFSTNVFSLCRKLVEMLHSYFLDNLRYYCIVAIFVEFFGCYMVEI